MKISKNYRIIAFLFCCLPCLLMANEKITYPGKIFFINGGQHTANIAIPDALTKSLHTDSGKNKTVIPADSIDKITIQTPAGNTLEFYYRSNSRQKVWVYKACEGDNAAAYIGASAYKVNPDGTPHFIGITLRIDNKKDTATIQPSFPLYITRKKDKQLQVATFIGQRYEASAFRSGFSRVLKDDPMLCEYMREQQWGYKNLPDLIENYTPDRKENQLTVSGKVVERKPQKLITEDLNKSVVFFADYLFSDNKVFNVYGSGLNVGVRSATARFFTYSAGIGYAKGQYIDDEKLNKKYPELWQQEIEVAQDDFSEATCFNSNIFLGGQIPFRVQKFYLIPAAGWNFGALWSMDFGAVYHGLQLSFDLGFKMKYRSVLFAGLGFHQVNPVKKESDSDNWVYHSNPRFFRYPDANAVTFRIGYKY